MRDSSGFDVRSPGSAERVLLGTLLFWGLGACGTAHVGVDSGATAGSMAETDLVTRGKAAGPLPGLGPELRWQAWLRPGRDLRADLRFEGPRGPRHEVLVWTPDAAILFDRHGLRSTALGERAGEIDGLGGSFRVDEIWWMLLGGQERRLLPEAVWHQQAGEWRGRAPGKGYRRPRGEDPAWVEILWRDEARRVHVLRAQRRESRRVGPGYFATRLDLVGSDLEGLVRLEFDRIEATALGDSVLDPIWEPNGG